MLKMGEGYLLFIFVEEKIINSPMKKKILSIKGLLLSPVGGNSASFSEVSGESVNSGFDENQSEFRVGVLSISLKMLSD